MISRATIDLLTGPDARTGLVIGVVAAVVLGLASLRTRDGRHLFLPEWMPDLGGALLAVGALVALVRVGRAGPLVVAAVFLLLVSGLLLDATPTPPWVQAPMAVPGAVMLAIAIPSTPAWAVVVIPIVVILVGMTSQVIDPPNAPGAPGLVLFGVAITAIFFAVPDTEEILAVLTVAAPVTAVAWLLPQARLGGGAPALAGVVLFATATGGFARPASIVGGIGCLGLLVVLPLVQTRAGTTVVDHLLLSRRGAATLAAGQLAIGWLCGRVAVRSATTAGATLIVAGVLFAVVVVLRGSSAVTTGREPDTAV